MLQVRLNDYTADDAHFDKAPMAEPGTTAAQAAGNPRLITSELHFNQVIAILRRRSSLILAIAGIGTLLATVAGLLIPPRYTAMAQLVIQAPPDAAAERAPGVSVMDENIDTHVTLLSSRDHLQRVIQSLLQDPENRLAATSSAEPEAAGGGAPQAVAPSPPTGSTVAQMARLDELRRRLDIWLGAFRRSSSSVVPSLDEFERDTKVMQERRSRVISVGVTSTSPEKAAAFANRIVQLYVDDLKRQKQASAARETARLEERIAEAKSEAEKAGSAVQTAIQQRYGSDQNDNIEEREADGQLRELLHRAGSSAQLYESLMQRRKEMRDRVETVTPSVGIQLLAGVPNRPSSHNPILFIFPAFLLFALGGGWLAVVLDQLDRRLRSEQETRDALGISCIGLVPRLPRRYAARPYRYLLAKPFSAYVEAIRSAVAALGLVAGSARGCRVVLISSSVPREGKTTLAASLAAYLGILGQRVLLLDLGGGAPLGDFRDAAQRGKIVVSLHNRPTALLIRYMPQARFEYLPISGCGLDPLMLFAGDQMSCLVGQLRESYDCVIVDGPPVLGPAEARLLPLIVDTVILVVKWGSTRREVAQNALSLLRDVGRPDMDHRNRVLAIVTQVDLRRHARYRYGDIGEFAAGRGNLRSRFIGAQPGTAGTDSEAKTHHEREHRPKVPGDEADGRSA